MATTELKRSTNQVGLTLPSISEGRIREQAVKLEKLIRSQKLSPVSTT